MQKYNQNLVYVTLITTSIIAIMMLIIVGAPLGYTTIKYNSNLTEYEDNSKVTINGYMSPVLSPTKNYFYLMNEPYCYDINLTGNESITGTIPIYLKNGASDFVYTEQKISIKGTLCKGEYKDNVGNTNSYRIINATYYEVAETDLTEKELEYRTLSVTGLYQDLWMYQGMFEAWDAETEVIVNTDEIENMLLYLSIVENISIETKEQLAVIINQEMEIAEGLNSDNIDVEIIKQNRESLEKYFEVYKIWGEEK